jgi:hypothetical protein
MKRPDEQRIVYLRGLHYLPVRCQRCRRPFSIPRLPNDADDPQCERRLCSGCARKVEGAPSLRISPTDVQNQPPLPFD